MTTNVRCLAPPNNLDQKPEYALRCKEHTELLVECLELGVLWDEYGLVGDVVVCSMPVLLFTIYTSFLFGFPVLFTFFLLLCFMIGFAKM